MRSLTRTIATIAIALPAAAIGGDAAELRAGRWQESFTVTAVTVGGQALPLDLFKEGNKSKFVCITPAEARDPARYFMNASDAQECGVPEGNAGGGKIALRGNCTMKDGAKMALALDGHYSTERYTAVAKANAVLNDQPFQMEGTVAGEFLGPCKGDEAKD